MPTCTTMSIKPSDTCDPETGRRVRQWTNGSHRDQHLYFTSPTVSSDDRWLVIISDRGGSPNCWAIDRRELTIRQLSRCRELRLAYCFPEGGPCGLNKSSPYLDAPRGLLYWCEDDRVMRCQLDGGEPEHLADLPAGWVGGFTHCASDGSTFCVPVADPDAFKRCDHGQWGQLASVPHRLIANKQHTKLCCIDTASGACSVRAEIPFWVTHVQFQPGRSDRLLFNSEGAYHLRNAYHDRIWRLDEHGRLSRLWEQPFNVECNHENFSPDGSLICYHGGDQRRPGDAWVAARTWEGELVWQADVTGIPCVHSTLMGDPRRCVIDDQDGWLHILSLDADGRASTERLCRHDTSWSCQDVHPHPTRTPAGGGVVFTSDRAGAGNVYEVMLD